MAQCMLNAEANLKPSLVGLGTFDLKGVTRNRRSNISPHVNSTSVDSKIGIIKVDGLDGKPVGTFWNFPFHGTCYGGSMMKTSGDLSGAINEAIERLGLGTSVYANGASGDISPGDMCRDAPRFRGSQIVSEFIQNARRSIPTYPEFQLDVTSHVVDFGPTQFNLTLERVLNCTTGGPLDICKFCRHNPQCVLNIQVGEMFVENKPRFTGIRIGLGGKNFGFTTMPGEAVQELAHQIRDRGQRLGYTDSFLIGYANNHMGYFTTPEEYIVGGYESLLSMWGINTGIKVRDAAVKALELVKP